MENSKTKILCVAQHKGGVSKTTSTLSLSAAWAAQGYKVLMIDTDPQANLTRSILEYESVDMDLTLLYRDHAPISELILETTYENLDIVPTRTFLNRIENLERTLSTYNALKKALPEVVDHYDYILIDTPPSLGLFTVSALLAATHVLVPVQPALFCQEGLGDFNKTIKEARESNAGLLSVRYFITLYDGRTVINQDLAQVLRDQLGEMVFNTNITRNIAIQESQYAQQTIFDYAPRSLGAKNYSALAKEVREWLESS